MRQPLLKRHVLFLFLKFFQINFRTGSLPLRQFAFKKGFQCIAPPVVLAIDCSFRETVRTSLRYVGAGRDLSTEVRRYVGWEGSLRYVGTLAGRDHWYVGWEGTWVRWLGGI